MFRNILVPLDGSTFAECSLPWAVGLSRATGADVHLATVHEPVPSYGYDEWESAAWGWSEDYLRNVREKLEERLETEVDAWVGSGRVVDQLLSRAETVEADLVVMASHGRGALTRAWLGSVADGVVRHAHLPVLLVRPADESAERAEQARAETAPEVRRILVPLDGSEFGESILDLAVAMARLWEAELHLLRVVTYPVEIASPYLPHTVQLNQQLVEEAEAGCRTYLSGLVERLTAEGTSTVRPHVVVDHQAGHAVAKLAEELPADLIVMATHGRGGLQRALLGSTTDKVVRAVHCPVLVRPPDPEP